MPATPIQPEDTFWSEARTARWLGVTRDKLRQMCQKGRIPHLRVESGWYVFEPHALTVWIHQRAKRVDVQGRYAAK